jgi:hypothetical protein
LNPNTSYYWFTLKKIRGLCWWAIREVDSKTKRKDFLKNSRVKPTQQIAFGALAGFAFELIGDLLINASITSVVFLSLTALIVFCAAVWGQKAPVPFRSFASALIFYWAVQTCLLGRTTGPGLTAATFGMTVTTFFLLGSWPGLALLRLWSLRRGAILFLALFPVAFLLATSVASIEEYLFVHKYEKTGVGATSRWTVSNHWLAYDKDTRQLGGSD